MTKYTQCDILVIGNFDGFHLGHQEIIHRAKIIHEDASMGVMTFEPHPKEFFLKKKNFRITTKEQKISLLESADIDNLLLVDFNKEFSEMEAEEFVEDVIINKISPKYLVTGFDFIFGKGRKGNAELLSQYAQKNYFKYIEVEPIKIGNQKYSSSNIRELIEFGEVDKVRYHMGRNYTISSKVVEGDKRGREIGFRTANIIIDTVIPRFGVYEVSVNLDKKYKAIANIGKRPSFNKSDIILEVHIFDFDDDIYGQDIEVEFISFIREEKKFDSIEELTKQIKNDISKIRG